MKHKIRLPSEVSKKILAQLRKDADFLCEIGIMDYSLLVGVHNTEYAVDDEDESKQNSSMLLEAVGDGRGTEEADDSSTSSGHGNDKFNRSLNSALKRRASVRSVMPPDATVPRTKPNTHELVCPTGGRLQVLLMWSCLSFSSHTVLLGKSGGWT